MSSSEGARNGRCSASQAAATTQVSCGNRPGLRPARPALLDGAESETFIQAAHAIPLEVNRHVPVADGPYLAHETIADGGVERMRQFVLSDLEACQWRGLRAIGPSRLFVMPG